MPGIRTPTHDPQQRRRARVIGDDPGKMFVCDPAAPDYPEGLRPVRIVDQPEDCGNGSPLRAGRTCRIFPARRPSAMPTASGQPGSSASLVPASDYSYLCGGFILRSEARAGIGADPFCGRMHSMERLKGILCAALSSSTFGLAPLFTLLLLGAGYSSFEVLSYRWGIASLCLIGYGLATGRKFRIGRRALRTVFILSLFRAVTSLSLVFAYGHIASGVASTIHFMYPLAVALAMMCLFGERRSVPVLAAVGMSIVGAVLLSAGNAGFSHGRVAAGTAAAVVSVFSYGGYIVGVRRSRAVEIDSTVLACYVMAFGALYFILGGLLTGGVRIETDGRTWLWILGLALPATAVSNMTLVEAIKRIGPTMTSVFGALEPLTAVVIGIAVFGEPFTVQGAVGILLIVAAVGVVILRDARRGGR